MSTINSVSSSTDQQWQLLQQLRASRAAETAANNGATGASPTSATPASATPASATPASANAVPSAIKQSGTGTTATASAPSGIFDSVAAKLMSGMQSFLVNMQSDAGNAGSGGAGSGGPVSGGSVSGYASQAAGSAASSLMTGLTA